MRKILFLLFAIATTSFNFHSFNYKTVVRRSLDDSIINFIKINNVNYLRIRENPRCLILKFFHEPLEYNYEPEELKEPEGKLSINFDYPISVIDNSENSINIIKTDIDTYNSQFSYYSFLNNGNNDNNDEDNYDNNNNNEEANSNNENYDIYDIIRLNKKPLLILYEKKMSNFSMMYKHSYLIKNRTSYLSRYSLNHNTKIYKYAFDINATEVSKYETNWTIDVKFNYRKEEQINTTKNFVKDWIGFNLANNNKNYFYKKFLLFNYYENN